jgi:hypothetical protein
MVNEACKSKRELMLFKVDFEKAYDSVDLELFGCCYGENVIPYPMEEVD